MPGIVPAIHVFLADMPQARMASELGLARVRRVKSPSRVNPTWMTSPAMTERSHPRLRAVIRRRAFFVAGKSVQF
jgi:hypothetical protein